MGNVGLPRGHARAPDDGTHRARPLAGDVRRHRAGSRGGDGGAAYGRSAVRATGRDAGAVVAIGTLDAIAQLLFAVALTHGEVGVVAALGTLYPVTTVLLAGMLLRERPDRIQRVGVGACLAGVVMLSA